MDQNKPSASSAPASERESFEAKTIKTFQTHSERMSKIEGEVQSINLKLDKVLQYFERGSTSSAPAQASAPSSQTSASASSFAGEEKVRLPDHVVKLLPKIEQYTEAVAKKKGLVAYIAEFERWLRCTALLDPSDEANHKACRQMLCAMIGGEYGLELDLMLSDPESKTYTGLKRLLQQRFATPEDRDRCYAEFTHLSQGKGSVRDYCNKFRQHLAMLHQLEISLPSQSVMFYFKQGLSDTMRNTLAAAWESVGQDLDRAMRHVVNFEAGIRSTSLPASTSASSAGPPAAAAPDTGDGPVPMEIGNIVAAAVEAQLKKFGVRPGGRPGGRHGWRGRSPSRGRDPPDPRLHADWPRSIKRTDKEVEEAQRFNKCLLCWQRGHRWSQCSDLERYRKGESSDRDTWRGRSASPRRGDKSREASPNGQRPR